MAGLRFGWGFFRDLIDWTPATQTAYGNPQVKADFLKLAADAPTTVAPAVTAFAGGGQGSATALTKDFSNITVCATAGDSVKLPAAIAGLTYTVTNRGAASANVFPATGDTINGGSANAAIALPVGATLQFVAINTTDWKSNQVTLTTNTIAESTAAAGVTVDGALLKDGFLVSKMTPVAINTTATATAAQIVSGYITSTSAAAVGITTPTATAIAALIGAVQGTTFDLYIDNSAGANTVTLTLDASIAVVTPAVTGGATLTVSTANAIGVFRLVFTSGTTAKIFRIG